MKNMTPYEYRHVNCSTIQEAYPDLVDDARIQAAFGTVYSIIWFLGITGNLVVLCSIIFKRLLFSVRRVFIASLACSDLIIGISSLPITAVGTFTRTWEFGSWLCHTIGLIQGGHIFISSFTLMTVAIDRYILIAHPLTVKVSYACAVAAVVIVWICGYALTMPMAFYTQIVTYPTRDFPEICGTFCEEMWPRNEDRKNYGIIVMCLQFGLPLFVNTICYFAISHQLEKQFVRRKTTQTLLRHAHKRLVHRRRRTTIMTTVMLASFILAWLPINMLNIARDFSLFERFGVPFDYFSITFASAHLVAMTSTIWNPLIYMGFQLSFRQFVTRLATTCSTGLEASKASLSKSRSQMYSSVRSRISIAPSSRRDTRISCNSTKYTNIMGNSPRTTPRTSVCANGQRMIKANSLQVY